MKIHEIPQKEEFGLEIANYEPEDLEEASPATVSRLGVVYMEPTRLGWRAIFDSWLLDIPEAIVEFKDLLVELFEWLFEPTMFFVRTDCLLPTDISMMEMINNSLRSLRKKVLHL